MTVCIVANTLKDSGLAFSKEIEAMLEARGVAVIPENEGENADFWIILGGDGTMLQAAHKAALVDVPLLGINLGTMGFLTDVDKHDGFAAIDNILAGRYESQKRLMLMAKTNAGTGGLSSDNLALNEVYVGSAGRLTNFAVYVNGRHMDDIRADGVIVATPTGSTAYNLSAGGPILAPYGQMMVVTAICPHSLSTRPWVIEADDIVQIIPGQCANLLLDGHERMNLLPGESIKISRAPVSATIIKTTSTHFYEVLRKKKII